MGNIGVIFDEESSFFNATSQILLISVRISWDTPTQLNGVLQSYQVAFSGPGGDIVDQNTSITNITLPSLSLTPYTEYVVVVTATTGGGSSMANTTALTPEAGEHAQGNKWVGVTEIYIWYF